MKIAPQPCEKHTRHTSVFPANPRRFIQATINGFRDQTDKEESLIPEYMFDETRKVFIKLPYSYDNEKLSKSFINKLNTFADGRFMFIILWQIRKIKSLFNLKDKNQRKSDVIYRAECTCGETCIGETKRNFVVRKAEHRALITPRLPVTLQNIQATHTHGTLREPRKPLFGGK